MRLNWLLLGLLMTTIVACGGDPYGSQSGTQPAAGGGGGSGGAVTGLLLNLQRPPEQVPISVLEEFQVVDPLGNPIFSQADLPPATSVVGAAWSYKRADAVGFSNKKSKLGENFYEIPMYRFEISDDQTKGMIYVSDATAAELRNMANLKQLLKRARIVILVGKQGE